MNNQNLPTTNIMPSVHSVDLVQKKAKSGNFYTVIRITFKDGYQYENFLSNDQKYIIDTIQQKFSK